MHLLENQETAAQRMVPSLDVADIATAEHHTIQFRDLGSTVMKNGLEVITAEGALAVSEMNADLGVEWIADVKLHDIPTTVAKTVAVLMGLPHPPVGVTVHTKSGKQALEMAQQEAAKRGAVIFGVTHLTSLGEGETREYEKTLPKTVVWRESRRAAAAGAAGLVCSAQELAMVRKYKKTNGLYTLVPGARSEGADTHDQQRPLTPQQAIEAGADLLVMGRQVMLAQDIPAAYAAYEAEVDAGMNSRTQLSKAA